MSDNLYMKRKEGDGKERYAGGQKSWICGSGGRPEVSWCLAYPQFRFPSLRPAEIWPRVSEAEGLETRSEPCERANGKLCILTIAAHIYYGEALVDWVTHQSESCRHKMTLLWHPNI